MLDIEQVIEGANAVDTVNENFRALRDVYVGTFNQAESVDLSFALYGGIWDDLTIANQTVTLEDDIMNYVVMRLSTGIFSASSDGYDWNDSDNYKRICTVIAEDGAFLESNITMLRTSPGGLFYGGSGGGGSTNFRNTVSGLSGSGSVAIDYDDGDYFTLDLTGNVSGFTFTNLPGAGKAASLIIEITQDSTPRTVTWPASFKWAGGSTGVVSTASGAIDLLAITTLDNGTTWRATLAKAFA